MKKALQVVAIVFASLFLIYASLSSLSSVVRAAPVNRVEEDHLIDMQALAFQDITDIYQSDSLSSVVTIYVTVTAGNIIDNTGYTWRQINDFNKSLDANNEIVTVGKVDAIVQFGDENGPLPTEVGYSAQTPNASIQIRGATTSVEPQKSYKIELLSSAGKWRGQSTIALNKHIYDSTRVRNKLSFDLIKYIPNMLSLRTQFVHLYVKDETTTPRQIDFVDYGLFTQVEQPNRTFLKNNLLDRNGQLYKATGFEFYRYPDQIRLATDPFYNEESFSLVLEIKGNKDHGKLIQMLNDVNNYSIPVEHTFEKYFDQENYFTWMAFNILVGNVDTQSQNFYLYSPQNGTKWYFIPWDYDGAFPLQNKTGWKFKYAPWENGVSNYSGGVLHNRVLRIEKYRRLLDRKITELKLFLTPELIKSMLDEYRSATDVYTLRVPDIYYYPNIMKDANIEYQLIPEDVQNNYDLYKESLEKPLPFYLGTPKIVEGQLVFNWDEAYDFSGQNVQYYFVIGRDWAFSDIVFEQTISSFTEVAIDMLNVGTYFWKVTAVNQSGKIQVPFDSYSDLEFNNHYGMKYLYITDDGQVLEQ